MFVGPILFARLTARSRGYRRYQHAAAPAARKAGGENPLQSLAEADGTCFPNTEHNAMRQASRDRRRSATTNRSHRDSLNACHCGLHSLSQEVTVGYTETRTVRLAYLEVTSGRGMTGRTSNSHHKGFCTQIFEERAPTINCKCGRYGLCDAAGTVTVVWSHTTDTATGWNTRDLITTWHGFMECPTSTRRSRC